MGSTSSSFCSCSGCCCWRTWERAAARVRLGCCLPFVLIVSVSEAQDISSLLGWEEKASEEEDISRVVEFDRHPGYKGIK